MLKNPPIRPFAAHYKDICQFLDASGLCDLFTYPGINLKLEHDQRDA